ncbi:FixH family protein [Brevibacillus humidisoli]|uniref:FixH family protein n=1 Tax=Brevibacillus humidisoli TaxID=2895522 RepID=UPI001E2EE6B4|nr:FixH family protein [Brevibacillus humidisoli]UFJ42585.1 FixH family protein [Brevibacillus humidisoli]
MKSWNRVWLAVAIMLLPACGKEEANLEVPVPIQVSSEINPSAPETGQPVTFSVTVKQGEATVDDAKEVRFELWQEGQEEHAFVDAKSKGDGVYEAEKSFAQPGTYHMMYHVTARGFHSMDKQQFSVMGAEGEQPEDQGKGDVSAGTGQEADHSEEHAAPGSEHQHSSGIAIHFLTSDEITAKQVNTFKAHIQQGEDSLREATVRFEYWRGDEEQHQFVDATEADPGVYQADVPISSPGVYTVVVHVEKGDQLHEHKEVTVQAK